MAGAVAPVGVGDSTHDRGSRAAAPWKGTSEPGFAINDESGAEHGSAGFPFFSHPTSTTTVPRAEVATLLLPALAGAQIESIAEGWDPDRPRQVKYTVRRLRALTGRLLRRHGWLGAARETGAETLLTGREQAYAESTLRKNMRRMAQTGAMPIVERALERQVEQAIAASPSTSRTLMYTDMFDQVFWSKKPTHAGPIGNRGNRILGATYFGLTFARREGGPLLAYHASWHKPATPLLDALQALHANETRAVWLRSNVDVHVWDRGGAGAPALEWAMAAHVPFLTVMNGSVRWTEFEYPRTHTHLGVPVFVRPDAVLFNWQCFDGASVPREIIFPAHPEKGALCTKALRYKSTAELNDSDIQNLDRLYKTRWPNNENAIKDLLSVGFDRNLDRTLVLSTSRGTDGKLARLETQRARIETEIQTLDRPNIDRATHRKIATRRKHLDRIVLKRSILNAPPDKATRAPRGAELLVKVLTMIVFNALRMLLARSPNENVRSMSIANVRALLLSRSMLTAVDDQTLRMYVEPIRDVRERELQQQLLDVANEAQLAIDGRRLFFALQPCGSTRKSSPRRIKPK